MKLLIKKIRLGKYAIFSAKKFRLLVLWSIQCSINMTLVALI